jgi:hypothetical protein
VTSDAHHPCPAAVYCEQAARTFDPDIYDCARCGHLNGDHCGPDGECVRCAEETGDE